MNERDQLAELTERLRRRAATSRPRSPTAKRALEMLWNLETSRNLSTAEKIAAVKDALRTYRMDSELETSMYHPADQRPLE
jgi:hypothetical protein